MIAIDTNILIYAHRSETRWFERASTVIRDLAEGGQTWAIPWLCVGEFYSAVTGAHAVDDPTPPDIALDQVDIWLSSPTATLLGETANTWPLLRNLLLQAKVTGRRVHDGRIAALCLAHGVKELWTADRDFARFPALRTRNPLVVAS
jgi:toxin-antitoxin system PIN domain toxin